VAEKTQAELARDRAVAQAIDVIVYIGVAMAISAAIAKRDVIIRAWMRLKRLASKHDPYAREVAEFRRDIADISRGSDGPDTTRQKGLWER
jgi:hypothetical protein